MTLTLNAGSGGSDLATDVISLEHYQMIKAGLGAAGEFTLLDGNSGNKSAGTLRVVIATDQPALTNKLLVTPDLPSGAATAAKQPALGTAGTASADVITVQGIASMTALKVDGSGVTQPVSNAGLTELAAAINGSSQMDVNIAASAATLTVASHAVTNAGTFAVQESGSALTALQLIDDIVYTDDTSTHATGTSKGALIMAAATPTDGSVNANDIGAVAMTTDRKLHVSVQDALPAGTNAIGKLASNSGVTIGAVEIAATQTLGTVTTVSTVTSLTQMNGQAIAMGTGARSAGTQRVTIATDDVVPASQSGTWTVQPGNTANTTAWLTQNTPATSGGLTTAMFSGSDGSSILVATAQAVKASAGQLYGYYAYNPEAAVTFVHFYNTAAGSVTVGTTNPLFTLAIPPGSAANLFTDTGITFSNAGWSVAATTTAGGNTAPATGVSLVVWYK